jgi:hypothetical protein
MVATRLADGSGSPSAQHSSGACVPGSGATPQWCLLARPLDDSDYTLRGGGAHALGQLWCSHTMPARRARQPAAPLLLGSDTHTLGKRAYA